MYPTLFHIGSKAIPSYGFLVTSGYLISIFTILYLTKKHKLPLLQTATYLLFGAVVSISGGKIFLLITDFFNNFHQYTISPQKVFLIFGGGGSFYGGIISGVLFSFWYLKKMQLPLWKIADFVGIGATLGYSIMKIGCFMGGCCYGTPTSLPWAVKFPHLAQPVHPTQLYESALFLLCFLFLIHKLKRKKFDGQIICYAVFIQASIRFFVEFYRGDPGRGYILKSESVYTSLSIHQLLALIGFAVAIIIYFNLKTKMKPS